MEEIKKWYCTDRSCGGVIGHIIAGELHLADTIDPSAVRTQGNSLILQCPKCSSEKVWFSSSPLVRSLEQFLDTMSYIIAKRSVNTVHRELTEGMLEDIVEAVVQEMSKIE